MNLFLLLLFGRIIGIKPYAMLGMAVGQHDRVSWSEDDARTMSGLFFFKKVLNYKQKPERKIALL